MPGCTSDPIAWVMPNNNWQGGKFIKIEQVVLSKENCQRISSEGLFNNIEDWAKNYCDRKLNSN